MIWNLESSMKVLIHIFIASISFFGEYLDNQVERTVIDWVWTEKKVNNLEFLVFNGNLRLSSKITNEMVLNHRSAWSTGPVQRTNIFAITFKNTSVSFLSLKTLINYLVGLKYFCIRQCLSLEDICRESPSLMFGNIDSFWHQQFPMINNIYWNLIGENLLAPGFFLFLIYHRNSVYLSFLEIFYIQ